MSPTTTPLYKNVALTLQITAANLFTMAEQSVKELAPSIDVKDLSYAFPDGSTGLREVFLNLPPGSRTLLIGGQPSEPLYMAVDTDMQ